MAITESRRSPATPEDAKHPVTRLAGPYGHPFHPILVTIPIGAWVASFVFDLLGTASDDPEAFATGAAWLIGIGIVGALAAALFGVLDLLTIPRGTRAFRTGVTHMILNLVAVALFTVSLLVRQGALDDGEVAGTGMLLSGIALVVLAMSGWLGGTLSYHYGVRVADERDQRASGFDG